MPKYPLPIFKKVPLSKSVTPLNEFANFYSNNLLRLGQSCYNQFACKQQNAAGAALDSHDPVIGDENSNLPQLKAIILSKWLNILKNSLKQGPFLTLMECTSFYQKRKGFDWNSAGKASNNVGFYCVSFLDRISNGTPCC